MGSLSDHLLSDQKHAVTQTLSMAAMYGFIEYDGSQVGNGWMIRAHQSDVDVRITLYGPGSQFLAESSFSEGVKRREESIEIGAQMARSIHEEACRVSGMNDLPARKSLAKSKLPDPDRKRQLEFAGRALINAGFGGLDLDMGGSVLNVSPGPCLLKLPVYQVRCMGEDVEMWLQFSYDKEKKDLVSQKVRDTWNQGAAMRRALELGSHVSMQVAVGHGSIVDIDNAKE